MCIIYRKYRCNKFNTPLCKLEAENRSPVLSEKDSL
nr:MAG TPA: RuvB-like 1, RuvB-like 2, DNA, Remodeller, Nucleosome, DNA Binding [Caudoviricetes sp.]